MNKKAKTNWVNILQNAFTGVVDFTKKMVAVAANFFNTKGKRIMGLSLAGVLLAVIAISVFIPNITGMKKADPESQTNDVNVMPEVKIVKIEKKQISDKIDTYGTVNYLQKVNVSSKLEEVVQKVYCDVGDYVGQGQLLASLKNEYIKLSVDLSKEELHGKDAALVLATARYDNALMGAEKNIETIDKLRLDENQKKIEMVNIARILSNKIELLDVGGITKEQYKEVENNYAIVKLQYESIVKQIQTAEIGFRDLDIKNSGLSVPSDKQKRLEVLKQINSKVDKAEVDIAKTEIDKAKLQVTSSELTFKETMIQAPISGVVAMKYVEPGEKVSKDKPAFTIMDIDSVYIELPVPETELSQIKQSQAVNIKVDAYPLNTFRGIVETIYPMVDVKTRTATVRCKIRNQRVTRNRYLLLPGMFVRADITTSQNKEAITVPFEGMAEKDKAQVKIFIVKKSSSETNIGVAVEKWVPFNKIADNYIEIAQGLNEGEYIAISGLDFLETGMRVKIKE